MFGRAPPVAASLREARALEPDVFELAREIIKTSDAFVLHMDAATPNFAPFAPHTRIATDGDIIFQVGDREERVVFPNPSVRVGQRAGLMIVPATLGSIY